MYYILNHILQFPGFKWELSDLGFKFNFNLKKKTIVSKWNGLGKGMWQTGIIWMTELKILGFRKNLAADKIFFEEKRKKFAMPFGILLWCFMQVLIRHLQDAQSWIASVLENICPRFSGTVLVSFFSMSWPCVSVFDPANMFTAGDVESRRWKSWLSVRRHDVPVFFSDEPTWKV